MWYLQPQCSVETLAPLMGQQHQHKSLYDSLAARFPHSAEDGGGGAAAFDGLSQQCCQFDRNL